MTEPAAPDDRAERPADPSLPRVDPDEFEDRHGDALDDAVPTRGYRKLPVVGLGGSAGGIEALQGFLGSTPADSGLSFVVVLHLAPDHQSLLAEILQRHSRIPVRAAEDGTRMEADTVYVIPPGKHLTVSDGHLRLTELQPQRGHCVAVDLFFRSLADTHGPHATAVVLSGADGDGAIGLRRIKERGGLTIAQDPQEAEHPSMPQAAVATRMVDWVLPAAEMPARILAYRAREGRVKVPAEEGPNPARPEVFAPDGQERLLREVLSFLHARTGHDFGYYKRPTVVRRIRRRMQVTGVEELANYLDILRTHPGEGGALMADLLISVTNFFRDREAFAAVEKLVPELFRDRRATDTVRVWSAACATGEEAYSLAMLLAEHADTLEAPPRIQVFGCDLDDGAIGVARAGFYPETIAADVNEERLRRFFTKEPGGYRIRRELRDRILFATHDLLKDAPFARIDLLSCRNLLIYLNREAQARALDIFHFALRPRGLLFLGTSESVPEGDPLFAAVDKKHRIYRQQPVQRPELPVASGPAESAATRLLLQHERLRHTMTAQPGRGPASGKARASPPDSRPKVPGLGSSAELHFRLLAQFGPASVVVDAEREIVHLSENASRFLQLPEGEPTRNLLRLAHPALRVELRAAMLKAEESGDALELVAGLLDLPHGASSVRIRVAPAGDIAPGHVLVLFEAFDAEAGGHPATSGAVRAMGAEAAVRQLELELTRAHATLRDTVEEYEASAEELRASNEELQAMNEELRSAGEELETGREELQSINEELTTVNAEFKSRVDDLSRANSDLQNLMSATQIATVFLDRDLHVMRFTPSAVPLFNLMPRDQGRPITDLKQRFEYPELEGDAQQVLRTLVPIEREARADGRCLMARVLPYRTVDDHIAGVVLTFIDITERKAAEAAVHKSEQRLRTLADAVPQIIWANDREGRATYFNRRWFEFSGLSVEESVGPGWQAIVHPEDAPAAVAQWQRVLLAGRVFDCEYRLRGADGSYRWFIGRNVPMHDAEGRLDGWFGTATDIDGLKKAEAWLRASEEQFRRAIEDAPIPVIMQTEDGQVLQISRTWTELTGYAADEIPTFDAWLGRAYGSGAESVRGHMHSLFRGDVRVLNAELDVSTRSGAARRWVFSASAPGRLHDGRRYIVGMVLDVTERRQAEEALRQSQERLRLIVDNAREYAIFALDLERRITSWNLGAQAIVGYAEEEVIGRSGDFVFTDEQRAAGLPEREAEEARAQGRASDERWHVRKDGSRFWASGVMMSMHDERGATIGFVKIFRDQTPELHAREAVEKSRQELREALRETESARDEAQAAGAAKDQFLAVLSHELRAPLNSLVLAAEMLARNTPLTPPGRSALDIIRRNARLQTRLVDDLLDVTRIARGKMELRRETLDLHGVLEQAVETSRPDLEAKDQALTIELAAVRHTVNGDTKRLQQVFWNLLKNASKFTPRGGAVSLRSRNEGSRRIVIEVCDSGIGFEPDAAERIFAAFEQESRNVTREHGGLGLGLAIAEASIAAHEGSIEARSEGPGKGATFTVTLPLDADA